MGLELVFRTQKILRLYDRYIDKYFAISDFMKEWLVRGGYDENKIEVIYNFADVDFTPVRKKDSYFLYAGRIEDYKGVGTLIKAIRKYPSTVLKIAGTGTADLQFRKMAKNMKNVEFLSFVDTNQLNDLFSKARAVVVPSIWNEPFGLVAIEAMAKGAPVIVSDSGALPEIVEDYVSGRIFSSGNAAELSKILGEFIGDEKYSRSIGEAAQKRAKEIGNQSKHLKKVIDAYSELI
ncbi:glycosyltransferase family 4 protein [Patescibacteria group bacterium]|nr:glycosyltransferase family 4 protein [Patescibacteria group bacterium]